LHCFENFLKRNNPDDSGGDLVAIHHRRGNRQAHLLPRPNDLRSADNYAAAIHMSEYFIDTPIDFFPLDQINLERTMDFTFDRTNCQGD